MKSTGRILYRAAAMAALGLLMSGCSVKKYAINKLGDSLAKSGTVYAADDDPELIGKALPFSLKLIEGLLAESPKHRGLLFAASSGFTQYSFVYVQQQADELEQSDIARATALRARARNLYLRARGYGMRALAGTHPGFQEALQVAPRTAVGALRRPDVPAAYWTAVSWAAAIAVSKDRPALVADQPQVEALIDRVAELDPDYEHGAVQGFLISYESARQGATGDFSQRCRAHFERAVKLSDGQMASYFVAMAETVSIAKQDRTEFESLLNRALAVDADGKPEWRLANLVYQQRARWLLSREEELFVGSATSQGTPDTTPDPDARRKP